MKKIIARVMFMVTFFWLGTAYAIAAHGETAETGTVAAPRAIECSAAFELMNRAAHHWSQHSDVIDARLAWADYVNTVSMQNGVDASEQVANEMSELASSLTDDPSVLAELAVSCVVDAPIKTNAS